MSNARSPWILMLLVSAVAPTAGLSPVTAGTGAWKVNLLAAPVAVAPDGVVTTTSTTPAARLGETAVMLVALLTVKLAAAAGPKATAVAPVKLVPVIVTVVPPVVEPLAGLRPTSVGAAAW